MKINYHFHSGVSVETGNSLYMFDYYRQGFDPSSLADYDQVFVFASHAHGDHFDKSILDWTGYRKDIHYIFSYDIKGYSAKAISMNPGDRVNIGNIGITALDSTDEGVAFVVNTPDSAIFHAGDLNWWHWDGEPDEYNMGMAEKFRGEIDRMSGMKIDIAFIPVDKRLGYAMYYSIDYLMDNTDVRTVCPIHFWDDWAYIEKVKEDLKDREYYKKIYFYGR